MAAPDWHQDQKTGSPAGTLLVQDLVQSLAEQISRRLNEGGNNTSTSLAPTPGGSTQELVRQRRRATGVSEALVISARQVRMRGALPVSIELEAKLYDAATLDVLWDYSFAGRVDGRAVPEITESVISALRKDGFVR